MRTIWHYCACDAVAAPCMAADPDASRPRCEHCVHCCIETVPRGMAAVAATEVGRGAEQAGSSYLS